jgi:hypothetical protein
MTLRNPGELFFHMLAERLPRLSLGVPVPPEVINPGKLVIYGPQRVMLHPGQVVLQLSDVIVIFLLSAVAVAPFLFHPPVILKEFV